MGTLFGGNTTMRTLGLLGIGFTTLGLLTLSSAALLAQRGQAGSTVRAGVRVFNAPPPANNGAGRIGGGFTMPTSPISPFFSQGWADYQQVDLRYFSEQVHTYNSPVSPFALYRGNPNSGRFRYQNGLWGRGGISYGWGGMIFPGGNAYFPYYTPDWIPGYTSFPLYGYLWGAGTPFLFSQYVMQAPPTIVYVPVPVYTPQGNIKGWRREDVEDYYLNRKNPTKEEGEPEAKPKSTEQKASDDAWKTTPIGKAALEIVRAWGERDVQALAALTDPKQRVSVYMRGKYQYSLKPEDYLDMTRDALQSTKTISFTVQAPQRKEKGVWLINGKHVYRDSDGEQRTVYVNYVLEEKEDHLVLTQVGVSPEQVKVTARRDSYAIQEENSP
jgi:hypothetical protein